MTENQTTSIAELTQKAEAGDVQAQFELAYCLATGKNIEQNIELGLSWLLQAADYGNADAQFCAGIYYFIGSSNPLQNDYTNRLINEWGFRLAKSEAVPSIDTALKISLGKNFIDSNINSAALWLEQAAVQNHVLANTWLALLYREGLGVPQNDEKAYLCIRFATEHYPSPENQYELARCYIDGKGTKENLAIGITLCEKSAESSFAKAQYLLACCYLDGVGKEKNFKNAILWLDKAAQNDVSIIENEIMLRVADAYENGEEIEKDDSLCFSWLEKIIDSDEDNSVTGEAYFRAALMCFDGRGTDTNYVHGIVYLSEAIKLNITSAEQWLENAYLKFTFPEFCNRSDSEECYRFAYKWVSEKLKNDIHTIELKFVLGVLLAFGKDTEQDQKRALECFDGIYLEDSLDAIDGPNALECFADIYVKIFGAKNKKPEITDDAGKYFSSEYIKNNRKDGDYFILPSLVFDFYDDINLARGFSERLEKAKYIFYQNSIQRELEWKQRFAELETQRAHELEETMAMFAHKFRSPLDAIIYNTEHEHQVKLYKQAAQTMRGLLEIFSIISTDADTLQPKLKQDCRGNGTLLLLFSKTLDMILLHLLSVSATEKIQQHYLRYAKAQGLCAADLTYKAWNEEHFELERQLQSEWEQSYAKLLTESAKLEQRLDWLEQHFFKLELKGFDRAVIQFKEYGITESFLTIVLNEVLVNAFKYYGSAEALPVVLEWQVRDGFQVLICRNPSMRSERSKLKGSGKGHFFLSALARKIGSQFSKPKPQDDFVVEFAIADQLLISS
ncbi:tetratricopeptide repeat protein [Methylomonas methanica]|nr:tetratricopeptide repeat protein [Methylomonas methanica]